MEAAATAAPLLSNTAATDDTAREPHADYFNQLFQAPSVVCGRQLLPLSVGRYRLLKRFNVAFVADDERKANAGDLLIAVVICSMKVEHFIQFASSKTFRKQLGTWSRRFGFLEPTRLSPWRLVRWFIRRCGGDPDLDDLAYLTGQISIFQRYIMENSQVPHYWDEVESDRTSGAHWSQSIEATLRGEMGWTAAEINEEPLGKAIWDYFKHMENKGFVRLMTPDEIQEAESDGENGNSKAMNDYLRSMGLKGAPDGQ
jgi:hypothetical protein